MTEGDRPTADFTPVNEVSDDTDVYPIDFAPSIPPVRPATPAPHSQQPNPGYQSPGYVPPGYQAPPGYGPPPGHQQLYGGFPPQTYPGNQGYGAYPGYQSYGRGGTGRGLKVIVVVLFVLLIGLVGLIFGLATGILRYNDLARLIGVGPGEIYIQNLRDDLVTVTVQPLTGHGDPSEPAHVDQIGPADVRAYPDRAHGAWDIRFVAADGTDMGTCELTVAGNGRYTFMVLPDIVVVAGAGQSATSGDDFVIRASPLCRRG